MSPDKQSTPTSDKNISINGDVKDSVVIAGDHNTVKQTIIQKFFNIFKSDPETLEHRNRRILLGHVENAWIKGVLDASLHGVAMLELGIKQDPEAVAKYPWAIKKEATDETLPVGTSMLEIFDSIGMGRSLLILGAPGSGKTTMLLELAREWIARAREDITYPIPMVFNLASWTEKLSLADWLAQELNNLYSVPRKTAPDWVKGNKLLLLLDGLDEVCQESQVKCVEAINEFRKQNGLTSLAVCSRSQDYADLNTQLNFDGAIEIQPLTVVQVDNYLNHIGKQFNGIRAALKKDTKLYELVVTPLFLSILTLVYRDERTANNLVSTSIENRRKLLLNAYVSHVFQRSNHVTDTAFTKDQTMRYITWLARMMTEHNVTMYQIESTQPEWLEYENQFRLYHWSFVLIVGAIFCIFGGLLFGVSNEFSQGLSGKLLSLSVGAFTINSNNKVLSYSEAGLLMGLFGCAIGWIFNRVNDEIKMVDKLEWTWKLKLSALISGLLSGFGTGLIGWLLAGPSIGLILGFSWSLTSLLMSGLSGTEIEESTEPGLRLKRTLTSAVFAIMLYGTTFGLLTGLLIFKPSVGWLDGLIGGLFYGIFFGLFDGLTFGGVPIIQHYSLRVALARYQLFPHNIVPFLDHCVDLIFLRRVGGGYIFVHRLLMEHFAEMYVDTPTSKGN